MPDPVDTLSFAQLVERMGQYYDDRDAALRRILVMRVNTAGPLTLTHASHGGKELLVANGALTGTIELHLPVDAAEGEIHVIRRYGPAPVKIISDSEADGKPRNARGHNCPALLGSAITVRCLGNATGTAAEWWLDGDSAVLT